MNSLGTTSVATPWIAIAAASRVWLMALVILARILSTCLGKGNGNGLISDVGGGRPLENQRG